MNKFNIYITILVLCLGSIVSIHTADYPSSEQQKEENLHKILSLINKAEISKRPERINIFDLAQKKKLRDYMQKKKLDNDPQFRTTYELISKQIIRASREQAKTNNLDDFKEDAQFVSMPTDENPSFGFYIVNMNKIKVDGRPIIKLQHSLDCGYHAAFNGLELYRFARGLIDKKELEELLPNFDVSKWKDSDKYSCIRGESYIGSNVIDKILKDYGVTEEDYSIIEPIEFYNISSDIIPKLASKLFNQNVKQFSHLIIINSVTTAHWNVAVVNKTGDQIRVYSADSLFSEVEPENITKILRLISQVNVTKSEFEALMQIDRILSSIADIRSNQARPTASRNESTIIKLLSLLPTLYKANVTLTPYFLSNFQQPILDYINEQLGNQPSQATGITKEMLDQLALVIATADLPRLPLLNFEQTDNTLLDKYALTTLLELHLIQNTLDTALTNAPAQYITRIVEDIQSIRDDLGNKNALKDLESAINTVAQKGKVQNLDVGQQPMSPPQSPPPSPLPSSSSSQQTLPPDLQTHSSYQVASKEQIASVDFIDIWKYRTSVRGDYEFSPNQNIIYDTWQEVIKNKYPDYKQNKDTRENLKNVETLIRQHKFHIPAARNIAGAIDTILKEQ